MSDHQLKRPCKRSDRPSHTYKSNLISEEGFGKVYHKTETLIFDSCYFDESGMNFIKAYPSLKSLVVRKSAGSFEVRELYQARCLVELSIIGDSELPNLDLHTLGGIEFCEKLTKLTLGCVPISDLSLLNGMNIRALHLVGLEECSLPEDLPVIVSLIVINCGIKRVPYYSSLKTLDCSGNCVKSLRRYSGSKLEELNARDNKLRRLPDLPSAMKIDVSGNQIRSLVSKDPEFVSVARFLCVSYNHLVTLEGLENYPYLSGLLACNNQIEDISALHDDHNMDGIQRLDLSRNLISEIPPIKATRTSMWNFSNNCIKDIRPLVSNFGGRTSRKVNLCQNLLSSKSLKIIISCPRLRSNIILSQDQRERIKIYQEKHK